MAMGDLRPGMILNVQIFETAMLAEHQSLHVSCNPKICVASYLARLPWIG
jgi:hypothetical protein